MQTEACEWLIGWGGGGGVAVHMLPPYKQTNWFMFISICEFTVHVVFKGAQVWLTLSGCNTICFEILSYWYDYSSVSEILKEELGKAGYFCSDSYHCVLKSYLIHFPLIQFEKFWAAQWFHSLSASWFPAVNHSSNYFAGFRRARSYAGNGLDHS